jgi:hypothetical protein
VTLKDGENMFQSAIRHPVSVLREIMQDPLDALAALQEQFVSRYEPENTVRYQADPDWETGLQQLLGIDANFAEEFWPRWERVIRSLQERGLKVGPHSFYGWNDGDAGFVRAIWCLVRHLRPDIVVETGVAHGVTSCLILEALALNGAGNLWSIDLPPYNPHTRKEIGIAVYEERLRDRWAYISGTSRRRLPSLLAQLRHVDLFVHDSMHSRRNVSFELEFAWKHLRPGGVIVGDDIDVNPAFKTFTDSHPNHKSFVCTAEPLSPDRRRFNQKGLFGIICATQRDTLCPSLTM